MQMHRLEPLKSLDLRACRTVDDIVRGMSRCSFGARMLGEATTTITKLARTEPAMLIYDGKAGTPLYTLLSQMVGKGWFSEMTLPGDFARDSKPGGNVVVVGNFSERHEDAVFTKPGRVIFINNSELARPGQVRDGYFPDAVFSDPSLVMPIINRSLEERLDQQSTTVDQLLTDFAKFGGVPREVANGAGILRAMAQDPKYTVLMTVSGAMTIAKMDLVMCDMIDAGIVQSVTTTGALMAHGLIAGVGLKHYKYDPRHSDAQLARLKLNRVTDTLEPETNFDHIEKIVAEAVDSFDGTEPIGPSTLYKRIGEIVARHYPRARGILKSAYQQGIPVFTPAFVDSEVGNDVYTNNILRQKAGQPRLVVNPELDSELLVDLAVKSDKLGIFSIGGGVPRNNVQNVAPLIEIIRGRTHLKLPITMFSAGVRISPDAPHIGHLSGCTYSENMSWRKMRPDGQYAQVRADATQVWPFMVKYAMEAAA
jgi:deoxyhypusine synthase